ncbi:MAG: anhydro-N-acetylmuramic acid kinase [Beijerinckiaceae bacterium]|nr:anhydro-N-acetylmuramic acid kinase [Beijerinckiaceae bacterium]MCZ8299058.1 anhydro-N-acetylmuramic acid kinase [Beijerinckiaceae bacterium]
MIRAVGAISGTSMDAIDVAVLESDGLSRVHTLGGGAMPYPPALRAKLQAVIADPARAEAGNLDSLEAEVTDAFAVAIRTVLTQRGLDPATVDLVGLHGQTVFHRPERRITRQLGNGAQLAQALGRPVVNRFRHADVAAGGQGAPLVPLYHAALAAPLDKPVVVLNLGGVANISYLDGETVLACDTGPASALIDDAMMHHFGEPYDRDGRVASRGTIDRQLVAGWLEHPFFAQPLPKSLDRNDFHRLTRAARGLAPADEIATLSAFTIAATSAITHHLPKPAQQWLVTGGGRHNPVFMRGFAETLGVPVEPVETAGWDGDLLEAECFAYLAIRSRLGLPLSLPGTTGVPVPMPGGDFWPA